VRIDSTKTITLPNPAPFRKVLNKDSAEFIPLTDETSSLNAMEFIAAEDRGLPRITVNLGWCTYNKTILESPEVEIMAGGLNEKTPEAAAIWRQGNLLEFGFEIAPDKMNETGRAMLFNSIVYIAKFTQDRPIAHVPLSAVNRLPRRSELSSWAADERMSIKMLEEYMAAETIAAEPAKDRASYRRWLAAVLPYLYPDDRLQYHIDAEAQSLGIRSDQPDFPHKALAILRSGGPKAAAARIILERYIPEGPAKGADATTWERWIKQNSAYLFFSEASGVRWYVDPLARRRGVPTASLRGPARADVADPAGPSKKKGR